MTVGNYYEDMIYLRNLKIFYKENVKGMSIKNRYSICKEMERLNLILNLKNTQNAEK